MDVRHYCTARGDEPVSDYLQALHEKERAKIKSCITHLAETGRLDAPHGKKLRDGLFEIISGRNRVLYSIQDGEVILLHAFMKKTQKTPKSEIDLAIRRLSNYESKGE